MTFGGQKRGDNSLGNLKKFVFKCETAERRSSFEVKIEVRQCEWAGFSKGK